MYDLSISEDFKWKLVFEVMSKWNLLHWEGCQFI